MNFASPAFSGFASEFDNRRRRNRIALGVAISLAVHALLIAAWRTGQMRPRTEPEPVRAVAVWLRPPPPVVPRVAEPPAAAPRKPEPEPAPSQRRPRRLIAVPSRPQPGQPQPFVVKPAPQAESRPDALTPHFDREGARKMARELTRELASMRDPAKADTAVGQFPDKPLETETKAARAIAGTRRRDCKDGLPGGLLGPLILLMDKKDSGCKW